MLFDRKTSKIVSVTVVVVILLFFLHFTRILIPVENLIVGITRPILDYTYLISNKIGNSYLDYKSKQQLIAENEKLKNRVIELMNEKSDTLEYKEENEFLRQQLDFLRDNEFEYEVANVIGKKTDNFQNILVIDKGEKHGLVVGQPVLTSNGLLIGKIQKINKANAFVLLLTDDMSKVAAKVQNSDHTIGIVEGEYGLGMQMNLIPQTEKVTSKDLVVTSGLEENVPEGIVVGEVETVVEEPEELFKSASIRTYIDFNKITLVSVIKGKKNND